MNGIAYFRDWLKRVQERRLTSLSGEFANAIDASDSPAIAIQEYMEGINKTAAGLFKVFSWISWTSVLYGLVALYLNTNHCSHLLLILVWPLYVVSILFVVYGRLFFLRRDLKSYVKISSLGGKKTPAMTLQLSQKLEQFATAIAKTETPPETPPPSAPKPSGPSIHKGPPPRRAFWPQPNPPSKPKLPPEEPSGEAR